MLLSMIGGIVGLLGSFIPEGLKFWQDSRDKAHELKLLEMQLRQQREGYSQKLEEVQLQATATEYTALQQSYRAELKYAGGFAATVRPAVTYLFVLLYLVIKCAMLYSAAGAIQTLPWQADAALLNALALAAPTVWTEADRALFSGIIAFWFGNRSIEKAKR